MTPLHWAIDRGFDNIAELLLEHGANPYKVSKFLKTPYSIAKEKNNDFIANLIEMLPNAEMKPVIAPSGSSQELNFTRRREEPEKSQKRERIHSYDAPDVKRTKPSSLNDAKNLTLQLLKEQMSMMTSSAEDNLIQSAIQSGRKIMLTEAGKRLLNDSNLNKFLKIPLNTTISSSTAGAASKRSSVSPRSATVTSRRTSDSSDILEIFRDNVAAASGSGVKKLKPDILNIIRSSSELQEVTITQRTKSSPVPSPTQKSSISLSAINVPKHKVPPKQQGQQKTQLPSSPDANNLAEADFTQPDVTGRQFSELSNNYQQLKRSFEREQQKTAALQRQLKQLEFNFESFKRQQSDKFDSILQLLTGNNRRISDEDDEAMNEDVEEIL
jgi:Ankyrin repeat